MGLVGEKKCTSYIGGTRATLSQNLQSEVT